MQGKDTAIVISRKQDFLVSEWYTYWIENFKATTVKKGTLESYDKIFHLYIEPFLGSQKSQARKFKYSTMNWPKMTILNPLSL